MASPQPKFAPLHDDEPEQPKREFARLRQQTPVTQGEPTVVPALGKGASAAVQGAAERTNDAIDGRVSELQLMFEDIQKEAEHCKRRNTEDAARISSMIERYALGCADLQRVLANRGDVPRSPESMEE